MAPFRKLVPGVLLLVAACGGGGGGTVAPNPPPPPPPPPAPPAAVATVTVTPGTNNLVPQQTVTLAAETKDANGNVLTGRTITWATSSQAVATVSTTGVVTAVAGGSATITATSEGKSGTATVSVADGFVGNTGGSVTMANGNVKLDFPAGAVPGPITLSATLNNADATGMPGRTYGVAGTHYDLAPHGTFTAPVTVTIKYDPAKLASWILPTDLALYHFENNAWVKLPGQVVDAAAHTVSAQTTSFSPFSLGLLLPPATLSPNVGSVNFIQRSQLFSVTIPGHSTVGLTYDWYGSGFNGVISPLFTNSAQYTMTQAQLPAGTLDYVQVYVKGAINPLLPNVVVPIAYAAADVNADLKLTFYVDPDDSQPDFGAQQALGATVLDETGAVYTKTPVKMIWNSTQYHGSLDIHDPANKVLLKKGIYTAKGAKTSVQLPPRIDEVKVDFYVGYQHVWKSIHPGFLEPQPDSSETWYDHLSGSANAFLEVAPKTYLAKFQVRTMPTPAGFCKTADIIVPKVVGATSYLVTVKGAVNSPFGPTFTRTITGATNNGTIMDVYDGIDWWGLPIDGGCGGASSSAARETAYNNAYLPATISVKTTP